VNSFVHIYSIYSLEEERKLQSAAEP
jgi:hypothetical protein